MNLDRVEGLHQWRQQRLLPTELKVIMNNCRNRIHCGNAWVGERHLLKCDLVVVHVGEGEGKQNDEEQQSQAHNGSKMILKSKIFHRESWRMRGEVDKGKGWSMRSMRRQGRRIEKT